MAVEITDDMYNTFTNNGYTEDDMRATVNHLRDKGMPDSAIFTALNKKHRELSGFKDFDTPQIGDQPNYDAILNNPALTPQQQAEQIKQKGEAYRAGLDKDLAAQKAKMITGAVTKIASPLVGLGLAPFTGGMSLPASMAVTGAAEGATFGLGEALQNQKTGADFAKDVATQGLLGGLMGAGTGALFKGASKVLPKVFNRPVNVPKDVQELGELATNPQAYVAKTGRPVGLSRLPKEIVPLAEAPTVGEAPIQQVTPNKFAIEADTDVPISQVEQPSVSAIEQPQTPVPEMVQPKVQVPQGEVKTRGGIKTIAKGFGEDVANQVTDRTYETRGLARNEAEFANLTPEQQMDLVKTDDISDLAIYAKQQNLKAKLNAGEDFQKDLNKYVKQGTQQGQAFQARMAENINTPLGALTATQATIRQATPKRINNIIDNADNIVNAVTTARTSVAKVDNLNNALKGTVKNERKYLVDRILKLEADGQLKVDNVIKLVNKKYNIPEITQPDLTKIQELTGKISSAKTERESEVAKGLLRKFIVDKVPKTVRNKVNTYRYINMLLSPKSRSKDFIFTAAFQGEQAIDEAFAQLPALASRIFKGINTRSG